MNITGKRLKRSWVLWATATILLVLSFAGLSLKSQNTGSLETECVVVASASSSIVPASLTPQEFCKVTVALLGNEWLKAFQLQAVILVADANAVSIAQLQADVAALQTQTSLQPQINAINTKLANMAAALK